MMRSKFAQRFGVRLGLLLTILLAIAPTTQAASTEKIPPYVVAIPPRGTISIAVNGHCLDYGLPFPGARLTPVELADDAVRATILHALSEGYYTPDTLAQTQQAIWHFTDDVDVTSAQYKLAGEIVAAAESAKPADQDANSTSLLDAVKDGKVSAVIKNFKNVSNPAYFGKGTLQITNLTDQTQMIHLPYGMVFKDSYNSGVQRMAIFPAEIAQAEEKPGESGAVEGESQAAKTGVCNQIVVTLPAKAETKLLVHGYCLNYGLPFPGKTLRSVKLADDVIRNTICYNLAKNYVKSDLWQAQLAVWRQTDDLDKGAEFPITNEIAAYAESGVKPNDIAQGCAVLPDAIESGLVSAEIDDFTNISDPEYFGKGTMVLTNLTDAQQVICIPFGTVFKDTQQTGVQDMGIFVDMDPDTGDVNAQTVPEAEVDPATLLPKSGTPLVGFGLALGGSLLFVGYILRRLGKPSPRE